MQWSEDVDIFDSSLAGCAVLTANVGEDVAASIGQVDERWRYAFQYEQDEGPRAHALRAAAAPAACFDDPDTVKPRSWTRKAWCEVKDFPEVPADVVKGADGHE
eukprot:6384080-Lingulodinium_polyedra.AAC.1